MRKFIKRNSLFLYSATILLIIATAILLRSKIFLTGDFFFLPDQARDLVLVKDMLETSKLPLIGARAMSGGYIFHGPLWIWMLGVPTLIFSGDPFLIAITTYLAISMGIVVLGFLAVYKLYGVVSAIYASIFLAISSMLVNNVSSTTNAHLMPLIFIAYLYFLIKYLRGHKKSFYFAALSAGLGVQFEGVFAVPLIIFLLIVSLITDKYILNLKRILITSVLFGISLATFLLFDLRHDFLMGKGLFKLITDGKGLGSIPGYDAYSDFGFRIIDRMNGLFNLPSLVMYNYSIYAHFLLLGILIYSIFLIYRDKHKHIRKEMLTLIAIPIFVYTVFMYFQYPVWAHYVYSLPIVVSFIFALAFKRLWVIFVGKVLIIISLIFLITPVVNDLINYFPVNNNVSQSDGSFKNQLAVVDYVFKDAKSSEFGYFVYSPQVFTYGIDYLMWWRGKEKYGYIPESKKTEVFYLIMYPPLENDANAHNYWVKNVIRTRSKIAEKKTFSGNIKLEKRILERQEEDVDPNYYLNLR